MATSAGLTYALNNGISATQYYSNIFDYFTRNPNATDPQIRAEMDRYGISPEDVSRATGSPLPYVQTRYFGAPPKLSNQQIFDYLKSAPNLTDSDIFSAMKTYGISPERIATATGTKVTDIIPRLAPFLPQNQAILLGDTWVQGNYKIIGSGEDQQTGPLESINIYKTTGGVNDKVTEGTDVQNYSPDGEFIGTTKMGKELSFFGGIKEALKSPVVLGALALATAGATGLLSGGAATATTLGTTGLTATELAALDLALGGAGGTTGATTLAGALTTGATVPTLTNLTGGSGLLTGEAGGITAQSVADKLAADAAAQAKLAADAATAKAAADAAAAKAAADAKALADAATATTADAAAKAAADAAAAKAATDAAVAKATADAAAATAATEAAAAKAAADAAAAAAATKATADAAALATAATTLTATQVTDLLKTGLTAAQIAQLFSTGATTASGLLQQATSREAALAAQKNIDAETAAAKTAAQFRPIGMTTRFGTSQFVTDPITGRLTSAGYTLTPEAKNAQDRLVKLAESGLQQAEGAQTKFAPLQTGAQSLFDLGQGFLDAKNDPSLDAIAKQYLSLSQESKDLTKLGGGYLTLSPESKLLTSLGSKYISQSPEAVAQNYLNQQMALLQPGRELELANLQNKLQQQGRGGLSVAQGGTLGATTPELQALYNARAMQEAQLAANAQQAGQRDVQFGAGLVGTGQQLGIQGQQFGANLIGTGQQLGIQGQQFGMDTLARQQALEQQRLGFGSGLLTQGAGLLGQYYGGQQAAYAPYTTALGQVQGLETAAQQPFTMGAALGQQVAQAGANVGQLGLRGAEQSVALATGRAATTNPYASLLGGVGASDAFSQAVGGLFSGVPATTAMSALPTTFGTGSYYGSQDLGLFL